MNINPVIDELATLVTYKGRWKIFMPNKMSIVINIIAVVFTLVGSLLASPKEAGNSFGLGTAFYSGTWTQIFFFTQQAQISQLLQDIKALTRGLDDNSCDETKEDSILTSYKCVRFLKFTKVYLLVIVFVVLVLSFVLQKPACETWPKPTDRFTLSLVLVVLAVGCFYGACTYLPLVCWLYCVISVIVILFRALGRRMIRVKGSTKLVSIARTHQSLTAVAQQLDELHSRWMVHFMLVLLLPPILTIRDAASGQYGQLLVAAFPLLAVAFVPWCSVGQALEDATEAIVFHIYKGDWLNEDNESRKLRLFFMVRAGVPSRVTVHGLRAINLPTCLNALRTWFSYLQLVLKL